MNIHSQDGGSSKQEILGILLKGVSSWNSWRESRPALSAADVIDLSGINLSRGDFKSANLRQVRLIGSNLAFSDLRNADLSGAQLAQANLSGVQLSNATLTGADLRAATMESADLSRAVFSYVDLVRADLSSAYLFRTDLTGAIFGQTIIGNVDLAEAVNLETCVHRAPSIVGIDTIYLSKGNIPPTFLRGAGVPDNFIAYMRSLAGMAIEFYSCFVSYSGKDQEFAERLHADLQSKGVRCWFAPEDLKIGDKLRPAIDEAIRVHDKLLVVFSQASVKSEWVEKEVEEAFEKERQQSRTILFPIRLDDAVMESTEQWVSDIRRTRHISDFRNWRDHDFYSRTFSRLLRDLRTSD